MRFCLKAIVCFLGIIVFSNFGNISHAEIIFTESWEQLVPESGQLTLSIPSPWYKLGGHDRSGVYRPNGTNRLNQTEPFAEPADGNQLHFQNGYNKGVFRLSGAIIEPDKTYTLSAAIGHDLLSSPYINQWSLQLWTDANKNGWFEWTTGDGFIGQEFGTTVTANNPLPGEWALNSYSFNSSDVPWAIGQELIVFLNDWGSHSASAYDNIILSEKLTAVPLPSSILLLGFCILVMYGVKRKRLNSGFLKNL